MGETENKHTNIAVLIERLSRIMRASEHEAGLNPVQWQALRYLERCNQFSNSPTALRLYLVTTKGTVSQTVKTLEQKGLLTKQPRPGQGRSVMLFLTKKAKDLLRVDPWYRLAKQAHDLDNATGEALSAGLSELLKAEISSGDLKTFGVCNTCQYFNNKPPEDFTTDEKHWCGLLKTGLNTDESRRICAEHENARQA